MTSYKLSAGAKFPDLTLDARDGRRRDIAVPEQGASWRIVLVYRGRHCPICTKYLNAWPSYLERLTAIGVDLVAASGDSAAQLEEHLSRLDVDFPLFHGLSVAEMKSLGLYISDPRSEKETDHPFAEPGLFVVDAERTVRVIDIGNNPFVRPDPEQLVSGLEWIRKPDNNYPIRGTQAYG